MPSSSIAGPRGVLRMERDVIRVDYMSKADERWRATDSHGHEHRWQPGAVPYPTLRPVYEEPWYCHDCRETHEHMVDHLECRKCGEVVTPGTAGPGTDLIPGMASYYLDEQPISAEEFERVLGEYAAAHQRAQGRPQPPSGAGPGDWAGLAAAARSVVQSVHQRIGGARRRAT